MRIQRQTRRRSWPLVGCALALGLCAVAAVVGLIFLLPNLPSITLQIAGFQPRGDTDVVFSGVTSAPTIEIVDPISADDGIISLGSYGTESLNSGRYPYSLVVGRSESGAPVAALSFTETSLMALCAQRTTVCGQSGDFYRNGRVDLRPGGAVVYAEVFVAQPGVWQNLGVVLRLDSTHRQLDVRGVDLNGTLYEAPPTALGATAADIEQSGNEILRQLVLETGGESFTLSEIRIDDSTLTLILR